MKLLYIAAIRLPTEKAHGLQIMKTCEALADAGVEVELAVPTRKTPIKEDSFAYYGVRPAFTIIRHRVLDFIGLGPLGFMITAIFFSEAVRLRSSFWKADVVYSRDAFILAQYVLLGRKLVYEAHTKPTAISLFVARRAYRVVTISNGLSLAYENAGISKDKIILAPDAIDLDDFAHPESKEQARPRLGLPLDAKIALYIGRLDGWNGGDTLCEAAALLPEDITVAVIGGETKQVESFKKKYPRVVFLGYRPYREVGNNQAAADVLVLPNTATDIDSQKYTSPLKLFTYMASERPIVASDLPSLHEVIDETNAYFFAPDNARSLADVLKEVFAHSETAKARALEARHLVERYAWKARAENIRAKINL